MYHHPSSLGCQRRTELRWVMPFQWYSKVHQCAIPYLFHHIIFYCSQNDVIWRAQHTLQAPVSASSMRISMRPSETTQAAPKDRDQVEPALIVFQLARPASKTTYPSKRRVKDAVPPWCTYPRKLPVPQPVVRQLRTIGRHGNFPLWTILLQNRQGAVICVADTGLSGAIEVRGHRISLLSYSSMHLFEAERPNTHTVPTSNNGHILKSCVH